MTLTKRALLSIAAILAAAAAALPVYAQQDPLVLDDFATGPGKINATSGTHSATQTGTGIIGGTRTFQLTIGSTGNSFGQPIQAQVLPSTAAGLPSAFLWSVGYGATPRVELIYGQTTALGLNLSAYNRLRVSFQGLSNNLNFNIVAWQNNGIAGSLGCNFGGYSSPFTVDFVLSNFILNTGGKMNWKNIEALDVIFQAGSQTGSPDLALTGFEALEKADAPATFTCPAAT